MQGIIDFHKLLNWTYLTEDPTATFQYGKVMLFTLIAMLLLCVPLYFLSRKRITVIAVNRRIFRYVGVTIFLLDLAGFLVYISRAQGLPFFDMRLMLLIWVILCLVALLLLLAYLVFKYKRDLESYFKNELRKRYLPRKK